MAFRGSLRQCCLNALILFRTSDVEELSILRNKSGKYFTLLQPADYDRYKDKVGAGELKLCLCLTGPELMALLTTEQIALNLGMDKSKGAFN